MVGLPLMAMGVAVAVAPVMVTSRLAMTLAMVTAYSFLASVMVTSRLIMPCAMVVNRPFVEGEGVRVGKGGKCAPRYP